LQRQGTAPLPQRRQSQIVSFYGAEAVCFKGGVVADNILPNLKVSGCMINANEFGYSFHWGAAASAYQAEGAWNADGKGASIWDMFTARQGTIRHNQNAKVACDFYNRYIQDLILMSYIGIPNFRFSLSWSRILPSGTGEVNQKGLDFYDRLVDQCLDLGIEPWITLYHWDLPHQLELRGGWNNRDILNWFTEYVEVCVQRLGDRVQRWMVLNEPMVFTGAGYFLGIHAPGKRGLQNFLPAAHHAVLCQALGGRVIRSLCGRAKVGTTFSASHIEPLDQSKQNTDAARRVDALVNRMFVEPLLGQGYPVADLKVLQQMERFMAHDDAALMAFEMDFIGVQNYTREVVRYSSFVPYLGARLVKASKRGVPRTQMDWEIYPPAIYEVLKKFGRYKGVRQIIVTENGAAFPDVLSNQSVHDDQRIAYFEQYLAQVLRARREGVPVDGYFVKSFTDNFEWVDGYEKRFGLVYVDHATQKRYVKSSGYWFQQFLQQAGLSIESNRATDIRA
jgi:beta-glucosidase